VLQNTPIVRKLNNFVPLLGDDLQEFTKLLSKTRKVSSHTEVLQQGGTNHYCHFLIEGWGCRYKLLSDGRRQIIDWESRPAEPLKSLFQHPRPEGDIGLLRW
jgi:CRP-like cAMP-binding protein